MRVRIQEKSPDSDKGSKHHSKGKKKKGGARVSIGDSTHVNDALSGEADTVLQLNRSL